MIRFVLREEWTVANSSVGTTIRLMRWRRDGFNVEIVWPDEKIRVWYEDAFERDDR